MSFTLFLWNLTYYRILECIEWRRTMTRNGFMQCWKITGILIQFSPMFHFYTSWQPLIFGCCRDNTGIFTTSFYLPWRNILLECPKSRNNWTLTAMVHELLLFIVSFFLSALIYLLIILFFIYFIFCLFICFTFCFLIFPVFFSCCFFACRTGTGGNEILTLYLCS